MWLSILTEIPSVLGCFTFPEPVKDGFGGLSRVARTRRVNVVLRHAFIASPLCHIFQCGQLFCVPFLHPMYSTIFVLVSEGCLSIGL